MGAPWRTAEKIPITECILCFIVNQKEYSARILFVQKAFHFVSTSHARPAPNSQIAVISFRSNSLNVRERCTTFNARRCQSSSMSTVLALAEDECEREFGLRFVCSLSLCVYACVSNTGAQNFENSIGNIDRCKLFLIRSKRFNIQTFTLLQWRQ